MRNNKQRHIIAESVNCLHYRTFGYRIERTRCLIENNYIRLLVQRPGNPDPLALPA